MIKDILKSIATLAGVFAFHILFYHIGILTIRQHTVIIAPLSEETAKFISVKYKYSFVYIILFVLAEILLSIYSGVVHYNMPLFKMILYRLMVIPVHLSTISLMEITRKTKDKRTILLGFVLSLLIHGAWNYLM